MRSHVRSIVATMATILIGASVSSAQSQVVRPKLPKSVRLEADIPYAETEHPRQRLNLLLPKQRADSQLLPVIAYIHGGAWLAGDRVGGHRRLAAYVSSGKYVGVSIGYRLTRDAVWPAQIHDCKAAIRWIRANAEKYQLDPDRIGVIGDSAGGHLVSMLGTSGGVAALEGNLGAHTDISSRVQCVIDDYGPSDLPAMKDYPSRLDHDGANSPEGRLVGGRVSEKVEMAKEASPIQYVTVDDPPILIIHGSNDMVVPYNQSVRFAAALEKSGVTSALVTVDGGGHGGFRNPEVRKREQAFFESHLRGKQQSFDAETIPNVPR
ncbi:MAG: alpha/beta hydrolase [Planctomycetota bacterium]